MAAIRPTSRPAALAVAIALALGMPLPAAARPTLGLEAGVGGSALGYADAPSAVTSDPGWRVGYGATLRAGVPLTPRLEVVTGLGYRRASFRDQLGLTLEITDGIPPDPVRIPFRMREDVDLDRLVVPVRLDWRPSARHGLRVGAGLQAEYLLRAWSHGRTAELTPPAAVRARVRPTAVAADIFEDVVSPHDATSEYERLTGSASGGLGWDVPWGGHRLSMDARWVQGLVETRATGAGTRRLRSAEVGLGFWY